MSEFSLSELKKALLSAKPSPIKTEIFGTKVYLRRLTAAEGRPTPARGPRFARYDQRHG